MVSYYRRDMKVPARPAPLPPISGRTQNLHRSTSALDDWEDRNDPFSRQICPPRPLSAQLGQPPEGKKKPPPRPPPPKLTQKNGRKQVPARPSNLLSGLFSRASRNQQQQHQQQKALSSQKHKKDHPAPPAPVAVASLIDFDSPSSSPTPTTHSSSDGLSINSFGSDGSASVNRHTPVGMGSSSIFESGFEDDFDFFSSLSNSSSFGVTPISEEKDPWSPVQPQDPFSPPRQNSNNLFDSLQEKQTGNSMFYEVSKPVEVTKTSAMPTIIRAKPARPPAPAKTNISLFPVSTREDKTLFPVSTREDKRSAPVITNGICIEQEEEEEEDEDERDNWSPPMPSIPPPPLPPEAYLELDEDSSQQQNTDPEPYGIAIYDYVAAHQDDLSFKANDVIQLLHEINSEWMYGRVGNHEGMFPANFVNVVVPLSSSQEPQGHHVKAIYAFTAETWDDLTFKEGDTICVLSRVNEDWLYGRCGDKSGQFPAAFVDHVPSDLPLRRA